MPCSAIIRGIVNSNEQILLLCVDNVMHGRSVADKLFTGVQLLIPQTPANTDDQPSGFWSSTPTNSWVNNTASGCKSGFWLELNQFVRGSSANLPGAAGLSPFVAPLGRFSGNTGHSNTQAGLQMYQHGYMPNKTAVFSGFTAYKNGEVSLLTVPSGPFR